MRSVITIVTKAVHRLGWREVDLNRLANAHLAVLSVPGHLHYDDGRQDGGQVGLKKILAIIALAPLVHVLATWDIDGKITQINQWTRLYSLPVILLELFILLVAYDQGWRPHRQVRALTQPVKLLILAATGSIVFTSLFASTDPLTSSLFAIRYAVHGLVLATLVFLIARASSFDFERWVGTITVGGLGYIASLTIFCVVVRDPENFKWIERLPSATNVRQIGNVVGLLVLAPTTLLVFSRTIRTDAIAFAATTALLTFIMWSGTRAALLSFVIAVCIAAFLHKDVVGGKKLMALAAASVVALLLSLALPSPAPGFGFIRIADSLDSGDVTSGRLQIWADTISAITNSPVFGHGAGTYRDNMAALNGYPFNHPHNFILQLTYDWGALGGGLVLAFITWLGWFIISTPTTHKNLHFLAIATYASVLSMALVEGTLFHPLPILLGVALIGPHVALARAGKVREP